MLRAECQIGAWPVVLAVMSCLGDIAGVNEIAGVRQMMKCHALVNYEIK